MERSRLVEAALGERHGGSVLVARVAHVARRPYLDLVHQLFVFVYGRRCRLLVAVRRWGVGHLELCQVAHGRHLVAWGLGLGLGLGLGVGLGLGLGLGLGVGLGVGLGLPRLRTLWNPNHHLWFHVRGIQGQHTASEPFSPAFESRVSEEHRGDRIYDRSRETLTQK